MSSVCFGLRHSPYSNYLYLAPDIAVVGTIFNIFSYDTVWGQDSNQYDTERIRYMLCHSRGLIERFAKLFYSLDKHFEW